MSGLYSIIVMFQTNKKLTNLKNIEPNHIKSCQPKTTSFSHEPPHPSEHTGQPYTPHEDYDYMEIFNKGKLNCPFGLQPQNIFPIMKN